MKEINISDSEWEVMRILWHKKETTSNEIIELLEEGMAWRPSTIKTLLGRLVEKELVTTERQGVRFIYRPAVTQQASLKAKAIKLFSQICEEKQGDLLELLVKEATISPQSLTSLKEKIAQKEASEEITCSCLPGQCDCSKA